MKSNEIIKLLIKNKKIIKDTKILCIGDIMLDHYIYGKVERMSPEAPIPILLNESEDYEVGGVGNVAKNITSFGAYVSLVTLTGNDESSKKIKKLIKKDKKISLIQIKNTNFETPVKTRYINRLKQIIRVDQEKTNFSFSKELKVKTISILKKLIKKNDLLIISDYNKGFLDKILIKKIIKVANENKKIVIVDPKKDDFSIYSNADIITPNFKEITEASKHKILDQNKLVLFSRELINKNKINNILITRSEKGMLLVNKNYEKKINAISRKAFDVTGAGDTVIAILSLMIAAKFDIKLSAIISNYAASIVIDYRGTAFTTFEKLINKIKQK